MPAGPAEPTKALHHALRQLPQAPLCVGYSGGLDSTVLLHALAASTQARALGLRALHVHHCLHPHADAWAAQCQATCDALGIALTVARVEVSLSGEGIEAAARRARHAAFAEALQEGEVLVLAHHRDDQAETFLMRALRASGPDALGAMQAWRTIGRGHLWRPLLATPRSALQSYAREHRLHWIDDPSNADTAMDRNFLRERVLPILRERWPHADAALAGSAALCAQAGELLDVGDLHALQAAATPDPASLSLPSLRALPAMRRARVLRRWIADLGLPALPASGVEQIERCLLHSAADAQPRFAWHGALVQSWRELLHAGPLRPPLPRDWQVTWHGREPLSLPGGGQLRLSQAAAFDEPVVVHPRRGGERIVLPGRQHSHALKNVLQDLGVPPWRRERLPLLSSADGDLLAAADVVSSARFAFWLRERAARVDWRP